MLVQFMVKNVLSFKQETVLDMTAINAYKEHEYNLIDNKTGEKYLKVASIYGANASGKSNFYLAMEYFQRIIAESFNNVDMMESKAIEKYYFPFAFEDDLDDSMFKIIEILGDFEYNYGFQYNSDHIAMEWLYRKSLKTNRTVMIFERINNTVKFGASVRKYCDIYKEQFSSETLILSFFNKLKLNTDIFNNVYLGIMETLIIPVNDLDHLNIGMLENVLPTVLESDKDSLLNFLSAIDTGIKDVIYEHSETDIEFYTMHKNKFGKEYFLNLYDESEGTIKGIVLYIYSRLAIMTDRVMFVDELNTKLHPLLLKFIIDLFYEKKSKAQLIYTTHDTTLMDKKFFRRDQIWFVQKDEFGYSDLVALSDFKVRSDASFEKDYLAGVYGGVPFLKEFKMKEGK